MRRAAVSEPSEPKNPVAIKTDALKNTVAVKQAVVENGNLGVGFIEKFAVNINS